MHLNPPLQLGDGTTTNRSTPGQVSELTGVAAIAAGDWHNLAVKSDGTLFAQGISAVIALRLVAETPVAQKVPYLRLVQVQNPPAERERALDRERAADMAGLRLAIP